MLVDFSQLVIYAQRHVVCFVFYAPTLKTDHKKLSIPLLQIDPVINYNRMISTYVLFDDFLRKKLFYLFFCQLSVNEVSKTIFSIVRMREKSLPCVRAHSILDHV